MRQHSELSYFHIQTLETIQPRSNLGTNRHARYTAHPSESSQKSWQQFSIIARQILVGVRLASYLFGSTDLHSGLCLCRNPIKSLQTRCKKFKIPVLLIHFTESISQNIFNFWSLLGKFWLAYVWHLTYLAQLTYTVDNVCVEIL